MFSVIALSATVFPAHLEQFGGNTGSAVYSDNDFKAAEIFTHHRQIA
ncbi:MAG: hypothetical protein MPJ50_16560 [Pirellulales bacterium]|nr:hypothetical protein [Pirellulales bacterium]